MGRLRRKAGRSGDAPTRLRHQLVAVGLVAVLLHVIVVSTALQGLREIEEAYADVGRIVTAQRHFQDADMAHDAIQADALMALVEVEGDAGWLGPTDIPTDTLADLEREVAGFREDLGRVDEVELPRELEDAVQQVRPLQEQLATRGELVGRHVEDDLPRARGLFAEMVAEHDALVAEQAVVTQLMSDEAQELRAVARRDEAAVQWRLGLSAGAALLGLLGLTALLSRVGRRLAELLASERAVAETLQLSLLPDRLPDLPGVRLAARYSAGGAGAQVGGDWYDVLALPGGKVGLVMGDVVGHDLKAASNMGQLRNALRACAADGAAPEDVLQQLNRLCLSQGLGEMATVCYAVLDPGSGTVRIASAGHYPPLLVSADGRRFLEGVPCPPVGAVREAGYTGYEHTLPAGSLLLLYTDGLVERRSCSVDDGLARLREVVGALPSDDLEQLCDDVFDGMLAGATPDDDVAVLAVAPAAALGPRLEVHWPARAEQLSLMRHLLARWLGEVGATEQESYDILVACSEAATNAVEHAYGPGGAEYQVVCELVDTTVTVAVRDWGRWREARGRDRGRGLQLMEGLMDEVRVAHDGAGTEVRMSRRLATASSSAGAGDLVVAR